MMSIGGIRNLGNARLHGSVPKPWLNHIFKHTMAMIQQHQLSAEAYYMKQGKLQRSQAPARLVRPLNTKNPPGKYEDQQPGCGCHLFDHLAQDERTLSKLQQQLQAKSCQPHAPTASSQASCSRTLSIAALAGSPESGPQQISLGICSLARGLISPMQGLQAAMD